MTNDGRPRTEGGKQLLVMMDSLVGWVANIATSDLPIELAAQAQTPHQLHAALHNAVKSLEVEAEQIDVKRLALALHRVLVPTIDDGDIQIAAPAISAEYARLTSEISETGTCWFCKGRFVVDALIAGYDTFDEQRLACLACNERMSGNWHGN